MPHAGAPAARDRNTAIDSLRTAMMCVVMFGHALLPYVTIPRRFDDPHTHIAFDAIAVFLYAFAMQAFFLTAGFAAAGLLERRGTAAFWRNRAIRIFVPLLVGYLLLTPLVRAAYKFAQGAASSGSVQAGWQTLVASDWLRWSKLYHLWFLASLIVFSAGAITIHALLRRLPAPTRARLDVLGQRILGGAARGVVLLGVVSAFTIPSYVGATEPGSDGWMQAALFVFFCLGWLLYRYRDGLVDAANGWWLGIVIALLVWPLCTWATRDRLLAEGISDLTIGAVAGLTNSVIAVGMSLGLLGLFQRHFAHRGALGQYASAASYWVYLVHFPIVIAAGGVFAVSGWPAPVKYLAVVAVSLPLILGSYHVLVRNGPLRRVLGG